MSIPYWGSRVEVMEVIAMARDGRIRAETTELPLIEADTVNGADWRFVGMHAALGIGSAMI